MKSLNKADGPEMRRVYALAAELGVPVRILSRNVLNVRAICSTTQALHGSRRDFPGLSENDFVGHADGFWANISADVEATAYPARPIKPGGITNMMLSDYPHLYGYMSAKSCRTAPARNPQLIKSSLILHQGFAVMLGDRAGSTWHLVGWPA